MRLDAARLKAANGLNDDSEESSELSSRQKLAPPATRKALEESYNSDSFEDVSVSGSGSRVPASWATKNRSKNVEDSMKSGSSKGKTGGAVGTASGIGESSSNYDEDAFDSLSKSNNALNYLIKNKDANAAANLKTLKGI